MSKIISPEKMLHPEPEMQMIELLKYCYQQALNICPPDEYNYRHRNLLYAVAEYLINQDCPKKQTKPKKKP